MWIDSDIRFNNEMFQKLVDMDTDIASGWYAQPGGASSGGFYTPVVQTMDDKFLSNTELINSLPLKIWMKRKIHSK